MDYTKLRTSEVTLNLDQTKLFNIHDNSGKCTNNKNCNYISLYEWKSHDENVILINTEQAENGEWCICLMPVSKGQTIVTGKSEYLNDFVKIIVTVEER